MDLASVHTVINYDVPSSASQYIHRVGRAGRGHLHGRTKLRPHAISLVTDADVPRLQPIIGVVLNSGQGENIPGWMLQVKAPRRDTRRRMETTVVKRDSIDPTIPESQRHKNHKKRKYFAHDGVGGKGAKKNGTHKPHRPNPAKRPKKDPQ
jgi:superfamily II DNA/RNA helicase